MVLDTSLLMLMAPPWLLDPWETWPRALGSSGSRFSSESWGSPISVFFRFFLSPGPLMIPLNILVPEISTRNPKTWKVIFRVPFSSQPTWRLYIHTKRVLQASMVALDAPESLFVSVIPKKLKKAMEKMLPRVAISSGLEALICSMATGRSSKGLPDELLMWAIMGSRIMHAVKPQMPSSPTATWGLTPYLARYFSSTMNWKAAAIWALTTRMFPSIGLVALELSWCPECLPKCSTETDPTIPAPITMSTRENHCAVESLLPSSE
mmetsp:Transcript_9465/g.32748  ORF Transcript_9465/g.32748 Transcript_9465/m.32748 type:complete len:265 (+) Transcript_9465:405-1199(+)